MYSALGSAFTGLSGSSSGLIFSFEYFSKGFLCVMCLLFYRILLLLSVWSTDCHSSSPLPTASTPHAMTSTHSSLLSVKIPLQVGPEHSAFTSLCFLVKEMHLLIPLSYSDLGYKFLGCQNYWSVACHKALYTAGAQNTFAIGDWFFCSPQIIIHYFWVTLSEIIMVAFSNLHLCLIHISFTRLRGLKKFYSFCIICITTIIGTYCTSHCLKLFTYTCLILSP